MIDFIVNFKHFIIAEIDFKIHYKYQTVDFIESNFMQIKGKFVELSS